MDPWRSWLTQIAHNDKIIGSIPIGSTNKSNMIDLDLKKIIKISVLWYPIMIFISYIPIIVYYKHFNINIVEYIDFDEILVLPFYNIIYSGIFLIYLILQEFVLDGEKENKIMDNFKNKIFSNKKIIKRFFVYITGFYSILFILLSLSILLIYFNNKNELYILMSLLPLSIVIYNYLSLEFRIKYFNTFKKKVDSTYFNSIYLLGFITIINFYNCYTKIITIDNEYANRTYTYYMDDDLLITNNLIGQTKNYLFIKNKKETIIFKRNDIKINKIKNYDR